MKNLEKDKYLDPLSFTQLLNSINAQQKTQRHHKVNNDRLIYAQLMQYVQFQLQNCSVLSSNNKHHGQCHPNDIDKQIIEPLTQEIIQLASRECMERANLLSMVFNFYQQSLVVMDHSCKQKIQEIYTTQCTKIETQKVQSQNMIKSLQDELTQLKAENSEKWKTFYLIVNQNRVLRRQKGKLLRTIQNQTTKVYNLNVEMVQLAKQNQKNKLLLTYNNQHASLDLFIKNSNSIMQLQQFMKSYPKYTKKNLKLSLQRLQTEQNQTLNEKIDYLIKAAREEGIVDEYQDLIDIVKNNKYIVNMSTQTDSFDTDNSESNVIEEPHATPFVNNKSIQTQTVFKNKMKMDLNVVNQMVCKKIKFDPNKTKYRRNGYQTNAIDDEALLNSIRHFKDNTIFKKVLNIRITAKQSMSIRNGMLNSNIVNIAIFDSEILLQKRNSFIRQQSITGNSRISQIESIINRNSSNRSSKRKSVLSNDKEMRSSMLIKQSNMKAITKRENYRVGDKDQDDIFINIKSWQKVDEESEQQRFQRKKLGSKQRINNSVRSNQSFSSNNSNFLKALDNPNDQSNNNNLLALPKLESTNTIPLFNQNLTQIKQMSSKQQIDSLNQSHTSQEKKQNLAKTSRVATKTRLSIPYKNKASQSKERLSLINQEHLNKLKKRSSNQIHSINKQNINKASNKLSPIKEVSHRPSFQMTQIITEEHIQCSFKNITISQQVNPKNNKDKIIQTTRHSQIFRQSQKKGKYFLSKRMNTLPAEAQGIKSRFFKDDTLINKEYSQTFNESKFKMIDYTLNNDNQEYLNNGNGNKVDYQSKFSSKVKQKNKIVNLLNADGVKFSQKVYKSAFNRRRELIERSLGLEQFMQSFVKMNYGQHMVFVMNNHHNSINNHNLITKDKQHSHPNHLLQLFNVLLDRNQSMLYLQYLFKLFLKLITINNHHCLFIETSRQPKIHKQFASIHFSQSQVQTILTSFENQIINRSYLNICQIFVNLEIKLHKELKQCQLYTFLHHLLPKSQTHLTLPQIQQIYQLFLFQTQEHPKLKHHLLSSKKKEIDILSFCFYAIKLQIGLLLKISDYINDKYEECKHNEWIEWQEIGSMVRISERCNWSYGLVCQYEGSQMVLLSKYLKIIIKNSIEYKSWNHKDSVYKEEMGNVGVNYFSF